MQRQYFYFSVLLRPDYFPGHRIESLTTQPAVKDSTSPAMVNRVRVSLDSLKHGLKVTTLKHCPAQKLPKLKLLEYKC